MVIVAGIDVSKASVSHDVDNDIVNKAASSYDEAVQVHGVLQ